MCREKEKGTACREIESACKGILVRGTVCRDRDIESACKDSERECVCVCVCVEIEIGSV